MQCSELSGRMVPICHREAQARSRGREEADTTRHILSRWPALMGARLRLLGCLNPSLEDLRSDGALVVLAAAAKSFQSRLATPGS